MDIYRSDPDILYAVVENLNPKPDYEPGEEDEVFDHMRDPYFDRLIGASPASFIHASRQGSLKKLKNNVRNI